jgi:hypothetical protein
MESIATASGKPQFRSADDFSVSRALDPQLSPPVVASNRPAKTRERERDRKEEKREARSSEH